jgi:hypothetical protein
MGDYYSLMCLLPPMPESLGEQMQLGTGEIVEMAKRNIHPEHLEITFAYLHSVDAFNWEQMDQQRDLFIEGGLLTRGEMEGAKNLPDFIRVFREEKERGIHRAYPYDRLWELYCSYAHGVADRFNCRFFIDYLDWEIGLRFEDHAILGSFHSRDYSNLIAQLEAKKNPLEVERHLDEERLRQIYSMEGVNGFSIDALLAYIARSAIYSRWEKISEDFDTDSYLWHGGSM